MLSPDVSILDHPKCELPCWNNIIPGETTYSEALQIVSNLDGIDPGKTEDLGAPWDIFSQQIWFYLYTDGSLAKDQTLGALYFIDNKAAMLLLDDNIGRTFGELVEMTGVPEFIVSTYHPGGDSVIAINPAQGVAFEFKAKRDNLEQDTKIESLMLFDPAHYQNLLETGMFSWSQYNGEETMEVAYPWKGYGSIEELYPLRMP
jgi:hypothetical protein